MKKLFGKNRLAILALAVMIGVAGYMSFADSDKETDDGDTEVEVLNYDETDVVSSEDVADAETGNADLSGTDTDETDASENGTDMVYANSDEAADSDEAASTTDEASLTEDVELNGSEDEIGDAVLTGAEVMSSNLSTAKLNREQSRSKSKEALMDIISDEAMSDEAKKEATDTYVKLSDTIEKETDVETVLAAKGYTDAIVTISDSSVDVALCTADISDTERAQIEDIVTRKTGYDISAVAISVLGDK